MYTPFYSQLMVSSLVSVSSFDKLKNVFSPLNLTWLCALRNTYDVSDRKVAGGDRASLELEIEYNTSSIKAGIAVFRSGNSQTTIFLPPHVNCFSNKEEILYEVPKPKFERQVLLENVTRIKQFIPKGSTIVRLKKSYSDIIAWREPARTVKYFVFYMFFVYYFRSART